MVSPPVRMICFPELPNVYNTVVALDQPLAQRILSDRLGSSELSSGMKTCEALSSGGGQREKAALALASVVSRLGRRARRGRESLPWCV